MSKAPRLLPSIERLNQLLELDADAGVLRWKVSRGRVKAGAPVVTRCHGYVVVRIDGIRYQAHRVIWYMATGEDPGELQVDHVTRTPTDNRPQALRLATQSQNNWNAGVRSDNRSGIKGVHWDGARGKWVAQISAHGKRRGLGRFDSQGEAERAYAQAVADLHGDFAPVLQAA
jgi:antitoxin (DNA-binding transcriptional repressor) of toxin-antitoxin stability system